MLDPVLNAPEIDRTGCTNYSLLVKLAYTATEIPTLIAYGTWTSNLQSTVLAALYWQHCTGSTVHVGWQ